MSNIVVEDTLRGRVETLLGRRRDAWLIAAALGAVVVVALVLWGRGATARIAPPATSSAPEVVAPSPSPVVFVDVAGAVRAPGLYSLPSGARVADALEAAGGPRPRGDLSGLNLAQVLMDGTKVLVPARGSPEQPATAPSGGVPQASANALVPLNTADQAALETVPGIGPVTATSILTYRERVGAFESIDQLLEVDGIGPATLAQIRPYFSL